uniref:NADH dehydrogenase [ubiquinone] 1 beta subcomplex subunit 4 n=1 Tax=Phallusia mammillata TaxID=59560 RepID=A0A6F9DI40_9ASCI|nr:uncharacterized protein LOC104265510 [Phallusia mammillata]
MSNSEVLEGKVVAEIKRRKWYDLRPRLNYRPSPVSTMPPTIDPNNWTPITAKELKAHKERLEIRGRLRREYWMKLYHPTNYKFFNPLLTDKAYTHFTRAKSVYHLKETLQLSKTSVNSVIICLLIPAVYIWAAIKYDPNRSRFDSVVKD